jgi:adenosylmethionine-8-amino-7-oxononanoate aminotransferase
MFHRIDRHQTRFGIVESGEGVYLHYSEGTKVMDASCPLSSSPHHW